MKCGNKVLLAKRNRRRSDYPGIWDFVGGHCEGAEEFESAMKRELFEELAIEPLEFSCVMKVDKSPDFILNLFIVTEWRGLVQNKARDEHELIQWFDLSDAKELDFINGNYVEALKRIEDFKT